MTVFFDIGALLLAKLFNSIARLCLYLSGVLIRWSE